MEDNWLIGIVSRALAFGTPLLWAALGETYTERAGVVNLGMEGMMLVGALTGFAVTHSTGNPALGILAAGIAGALFSALHALMTVTLRANQYVSGLALTILGTGATGLLGKPFEGQPLLDTLENISVPVLKDIPFIGPMLFTDQSLLTYIGIGVGVVLWMLLYKSRLGIMLRSAGENPKAVDAQGLNVTLIRYAAVIFGGFMAGIAGGFFSVAYRPSWTQGTTGGVGWIALAIVIFGRWNPLYVMLGSVFFGSLYVLSFRLQDKISPEFLNMMPYLFVIVVLILTALGKKGTGGVPEALGTPYRRGER
ncbi:ABC transporter permease [Deinococcus misasensis]|uniref:ABC transporter permease n=1 Tax=Deinococcus misasensis TaxID=392413 RepID=UPI00054F24B0|nr:ABC transporter permease [Deinococcus misasensis]